MVNLCERCLCLKIMFPLLELVKIVHCHFFSTSFNSFYFTFRPHLVIECSKLRFLTVIMNLLIDPCVSLYFCFFVS